MRARLVAMSVLAVLTGCSRAAATPPGGAGPAPESDAGLESGTAAPPPCFTNPKTYLEIINACTDAQAVDKTDDLSRMNVPDGGLRPLP